MYLILNCGSQTIKYEIFEPDTLERVERVVYKEFENYEDKLEEVIDEARENFDISAAGHRVVHGGDVFFEPTEMNEEKISKLEAITHLAPLHNPYNLAGIKAVYKKLNVPNIAVFDTGFYKDLPSVASTYAIPASVREKYKIKRFGFHGISHKKAALKAAEKMGDELSDLRLVSCHLGGGASVTAVNKGRAIDTSMGLTPLEGLVMMTRSGDIDPGAVTLLSQKMGADEAEHMLNNDSGMKALCGEDDMLSIIEKVEKGEEKFVRAFDIYIYRIKKYIGAYVAAMGGCDAVIFTGGIGAGKPITREKVMEGMDKVLGEVEVMAIEPDEGEMIAEEVAEFLISNHF